MTADANSPSLRRVLVIEDDEAVAHILVEGLAKVGYTVNVANSGERALLLIEQFLPHLVITDHDMPGLTGLEMLRQLRQRKNYVTVMFVTGHTDHQLAVEAFRAGADDYVRKPFRFNEFLARVDACLRHYDLHKELLEANQKLNSLVEHDDLTGLYNMRTMYQRIDYELKRTRRNRKKVACVMVDMDHFKRVNDQHDHLFGSFVLKEVGRLIARTMREVDFAARYGGDEFLIVLVEVEEAGAQAFCTRLKDAVEQYQFQDSGHSIRLTASLGYALAGADAVGDSRDLVRAADRALYEAKEAGRNCVRGHEIKANHS